MKTMPFGGPSFHKMVRVVKKLTLFNSCCLYLFTRFDQNFIKLKTFWSLLWLKITNLRFSLSALSFLNPHCAGSSLLKLEVVAHHFATESALCRKPEECLIRRKRTSSSFSSYCRVISCLDVLLLNLGPVGNSTVWNIVFKCAKSKTLTSNLCSGNIHQLKVNWKRIQDI